MVSRVNVRNIHVFIWVLNLQISWNSSPSSFLLQNVQNCLFLSKSQNTPNSRENYVFLTYTNPYAESIFNVSM
jgi:hypothetical protein